MENAKSETKSCHINSAIPSVIKVVIMLGFSCLWSFLFISTLGSVFAAEKGE